MKTSDKMGVLIFTLVIMVSGMLFGCRPAGTTTTPATTPPTVSTTTPITAPGATTVSFPGQAGVISAYEVRPAGNGPFP